MIFRFSPGITAGAGTGTAVLSIGNACPFTIGDIMACIFVCTVRTGGAGNRSLMLCTGIVRPHTISQVMTGSFGGTVTTGAAYSTLMLRRSGGSPRTVGQ